MASWAPIKRSLSPALARSSQWFSHAESRAAPTNSGAPRRVASSRSTLLNDWRRASFSWKSLKSNELTLVHVQWKSDCCTWPDNLSYISSHCLRWATQSDTIKISEVQTGFQWRQRGVNGVAEEQSANRSTCLACFSAHILFCLRVPNKGTLIRQNNIWAEKQARRSSVSRLTVCV